MSEQPVRLASPERPSQTSPGTSAVEGPIQPGAEPVEVGSGDLGLLILHGFGDTPQSVRALATQAAEEGWTAHAPLLHGHGRSLEDLTRSRAAQWLADARSALHRLQRRHDRVGIIGQSMGGALATILATEARVHALVLLAPFMRLPRRARRIAAFHWAVSPFVHYLRSRSECSILDPVARRGALGRGVTTPRLLHELAVVVRLAKRAAPRLRVPTLVMHSRQDPRVSTDDAEAAFSRLGARNKRLCWVERSGHVITVDFDRELVARDALDWLRTHVPRSGDSA